MVTLSNFSKGYPTQTLQGYTPNLSMAAFSNFSKGYPTQSQRGYPPSVRLPTLSKVLALPKLYIKPSILLYLLCLVSMVYGDESVTDQKKEPFMVYPLF